MPDVDADATHPPRVGCVSYLNAKPLIHGLTEQHPGRLSLHLDVPAKLLAGLESGQLDLALCPVIDAFRSVAALKLIPVGGIACAGPTLTVRLFSRVPVERVTAVHADTDSHTSVALLRVLLHELNGLTPELIHYDARARTADGRPIDPGHPPEALLLIGDKVVTDAPPATVYPHGLDLGEAWHDLTGRPFVFATWMARADTDLGDLPELLSEQRERNLDRLDLLVETYAADHGWPANLAKRYLGQILCYRLGDVEREAIHVFAQRAAALGLCDPNRLPTTDDWFSAP
jgi:chorismate dehydratase